MDITIDVLKTDVMNGNQVYTIELTRALLRYFPEHQYNALLYLNKKQQAQKTFGSNQKLRYLNILPHNNLVGKSLKPLVSRAVNLAIHSVARHSDIYHCTNPNRFPLGISNGIVTLHDLIALRSEAWVSAGSQEFYRKNIFRILKEAKIVLTVSEFTRQDAIRHFPACEEKLIVTPLAAAPVFRKTVVNRSFLAGYGIPDTKKPYLLYVGELQPRKNIGSLLCAFDVLPPRLRNELQVIIVGSAKSPENREHFRAAVQAMKHRDQVFHLVNVPVEDLVLLYSAAHAFVYLSFYEGFGLPVLEAMSCGCPVLTANNSSLKEIAGNAAITVDPSDTDAVRDCLIRLLTENTLQENLKKLGMIRSAEYTWEETARKTVEGYRLAIERT